MIQDDHGVYGNEIRLLPTTLGGAIHCCFSSYQKELEDRKRTNPQDLPSWHDLEIVYFFGLRDENEKDKKRLLEIQSILSFLEKNKIVDNQERPYSLLLSDHADFLTKYSPFSISYVLLSEVLQSKK